MIKPLYIESLQMPGGLTLRGPFRPGLTGNTCFSKIINYFHLITIQINSKSV